MGVVNWVCMTTTFNPQEFLCGVKCTSETTGDFRISAALLRDSQPATFDLFAMYRHTSTIIAIAVYYTRADFVLQVGIHKH